MESRVAGSKGEYLRNQVYNADEATIETLGTALIEGRNFTSADVVRHPLVQSIISAYDALDRTRERDRIAGIFTGNRELTGLLPAVDLLGVDERAEAADLIDRHFDGQGSYALVAVLSSPTRDSAIRSLARAVQASSAGGSGSPAPNRAWKRKKRRIRR